MGVGKVYEKIGQKVIQERTGKLSGNPVSFLFHYQSKNCKHLAINFEYSCDEII